jgi:hypothetical protein
MGPRETVHGRKLERQGGRSLSYPHLRALPVEFEAGVLPVDRHGLKGLEMVLASWDGYC